MRIPNQFQSELDDYSGSDFERGHLVPSAACVTREPRDC
ncbi:MAG: DNA/RNA non-specific endonuclease [Geminicoccaceae bacterium]